MSTAVGDLRFETRARAQSRVRTRAPRDPWLLFLLIFATDLAFGLWMNSRGIHPQDAASRASIALTAVHGSDPHLSAIGFTWMPLPTFLELGTTAFFPLWGGVVTSGFAFTAITALAAGATGALLLWSSFRLGLPRWVGWSFALLVAANPMLFLYGANGMSEGVGAPFFVGAVCFLTLYWHSGERLYVGVAGIALAFAFLCVYEAAPYGVALALALGAGVFWSSESRGRNRQGSWRAAEGLGLALAVPSLFVGALWLALNAIVVKDPLYFTNGPYSSFAQNRALEAAGSGGAYLVAGDFGATIGYTTARTWPFLVPVAFVLIVRALDRRLFHMNSLALLIIAFSVPFGFVAPLVYRGLSIGYLRYFMFPLFVAAGWSLFEIAISRRRRLAALVLLTGWLLAAGGTLWVISHRSLALESENFVLDSVRTGKDARELGFENSIWRARPIARFLEEGPLNDGDRIAADQIRAYAIASNLHEAHLAQLILAPDQRFARIVANPWKFGVKYLLVPNPRWFPTDAINRARPRLWAGGARGFRLVTDFPGSPTPEEWRLYGVPPAPAQVGGAGSSDAARGHR